MTKTKLLQKTKADLLKIAKRLGLRGISTMNKPDLAEEIASARQAAEAKKTAAAKRKNASVAAAAAAKSKTSLKRRARRKTGADAKLVLAARPKRKKPAATTSTQAAAATKKSVAKPSATKAVAKTKAVPVSAREKRSAPIPRTAKPAPAKTKSSAKPVAPTPSQPSPDELPVAYGTGKLFLIARDPHWLYAYWDLSPDQMTAYAKKSSDGKILLQVFQAKSKKPLREFAVNHGTRDSYLSVTEAGASYHIALVYRRKNGTFETISKSAAVTTPPEELAEPAAPPRFVSIPVDVPYGELMELAKTYAQPGETLSDTLQRLESEGFNLPFQVSLPVGPWTDQQASELEQILTGEFMVRRQVGSAEVSEWLSRRLRRLPSSGVFSAVRPAGASWFSPVGASWSKQRGKGFWFAINAELIIYGATEPDARVTVDGKPIELQPDGTFSFHYTFPDGHYKLPVVAISRDGDDQRAAELTFDRRTEEQGEVGKVSQPAHLKSPANAP